MNLRLGPCCACGGTQNVRNILQLHQKGPTPGRGWGCVVCQLPMDGAIAVVCDHCLDTKAPLKFACDDYPASGKRVPIETLTGTHDHDLAKHHAYETHRQYFPPARASVFNMGRN